jgi:hypothetical protein
MVAPIGVKTFQVQGLSENTRGQLLSDSTGICKVCPFSHNPNAVLPCTILEDGTPQLVITEIEGFPYIQDWSVKLRAALTNLTFPDLTANALGNTTDIRHRRNNLLGCMQIIGKGHLVLTSEILSPAPVAFIPPEPEAPHVYHETLKPLSRRDAADKYYWEKD